jgi:hypothetical protein
MVLADDVVFPEMTYVRLDPVKLVPDKFTFVKSKPLRSVLIKFMLGPTMYPRVKAYPVGMVGCCVYCTPSIVAVVLIPPLVAPTNMAFVRSAPVRLELVSVDKDKLAPDKSTNGPIKYPLATLYALVGKTVGWSVEVVMIPDFTSENSALVKFIARISENSKLSPLASTPLKSIPLPTIYAGFEKDVTLGFTIRYPLGRTVLLE